MTKEKIKKCYCSNCNRNTNHETLFSINDNFDEDLGFWYETTYSVIRCLGCDTIQFHKKYIDEDSFVYYGDGEMEECPSITTYPNQKKLVDPIPDTSKLPDIVRNLYVETLFSLNNQCLQLSAAGFRAIIEAVCKEANVSGKNLETMINNMSKAHIITAKDRDHLHAIRFMGNDSIHSLKKYTESEVVIVAHIVNAIITSLYLIEKEVEELKIKPISTYDEFVKIIDENLKNYKVGQVDVLRNLTARDRRIIKDDYPKFEDELKTRIKAGSYTKLSLCPAPASGRSQQYKIEAI